MFGCAALLEEVVDVDDLGMPGWMPGEASGTTRPREQHNISLLLV
jgi:hypothetical protein